MTQLTTIELSKEYLKFSAGHFTVFSATERERLHGHNFSVSALTEKLWPCSLSRSVAEKTVKWPAENLRYSLDSSIVVSWVTCFFLRNIGIKLSVWGACCLLLFGIVFQSSTFFVIYIIEIVIAQKVHGFQCSKSI